MPYMIYPEGNFIEVSEEQPFFQIGETKYGKPILVRAYDKMMSYEEAIKTYGFFLIPPSSVNCLSVS